MATAHSCKFPDATNKAIKKHKELPEKLKSILNKEERYFSNNSPKSTNYKYNNWDLFANPIVHLHDVESAYDMAINAGFEVISIKFRSDQKIEDCRKFLKDFLLEMKLDSMVSIINNFSDKEVYILVESLISPNAFNINYRKSNI